MRAKTARQIRNALKAQGVDLKAPAQYFIASKKKVMTYVEGENGVVEAKPVDRIVIVNQTKNKYRKVKKMLKMQRRLGLLNVA